VGIAEVILKVTDRASSELRKVADEGKKTDKAIDNLATGLLGLGAGLVAAGGAGLAFAQQMADMQNDISDMSARTAVGTDTLSALRVMAEATGRQFQDLNEVLNPLVARMGQVAAGNEAVTKQFSDLGIGVLDANDKMLSTDAVLRDIMSTLTAIEDPTERATAAVSLLGESGGKLVQIMGAGEFDAFAEFVSTFGTDTGPKAAKAAAEWQVATALLKETVRGALSEFAGIETATELVVQLAGAVAFVAESFRALLAFPGEFLSRLSQAMSQAFDLINTVAAKIRDALPDNILFADLRRQVALIADVGAEGAFQFRQDPSEAQQFDPFAARAELIAGFRDVLASSIGAPSGGAGGLPLAGADAPGEGLKKADKAATDFAAVMNEGLGLLGDFNDEADKAARALAEAEKAARELALAQTQQVVGMAQQALTGDVSGLIGSVGAAAGPAGMVAAQIVQGIETIGKLGASGVKKKLEEFQANMLAGLKALPEIIGKVLPEFISEFVPALITGLVEALPALMLAQAEAFGKTVKAAFSDIPQDIAESFTIAFLNVWERMKDFFESLFRGRFKEAFGKKGPGGDFKKFLGSLLTLRFKKAFQTKAGKTTGKAGRVTAALFSFGLSELGIAIGKGVGKGVKNATEGRSFARGGVVDRTGLAMVHAGERFTRQDGSMSGTTRAAMGGGGGGVVINLQGIMTKRDLIEQIRRELGDRGSGLTLDPFTS